MYLQALNPGGQMFGSSYANQCSCGTPAKQPITNCGFTDPFMQAYLKVLTPSVASASHYFFFIYLQARISFSLLVLGNP